MKMALETKNIHLGYCSPAMNNLLDLLSNVSKRPTTGKKVIAKSPLLPAEMIYALNQVAYNPYFNESLLHTVIKGNIGYSKKAKESGMGQDFSPLNLIMLGSAITGKEAVAADIFAGLCGCGNWDDQMVKSFQLMACLKDKPIRFLEVPRYDVGSFRSARTFIDKEFEQFMEWLAVVTEIELDRSSMRQAIMQGNLLRLDLVELDSLVQGHPGVLPALEFYLVQSLMGDYAGNPQALHLAYRALIEELGSRAEEREISDNISERPFKIYLTGEPTLELGLFNIIEDYGAVLVGCDIWLSLYYKEMDETLRPEDAISGYIFNMPTNLGTAARARFTVEHIKKQGANGIIMNNLSKSKAISSSERFFRDIIKNHTGLPVLSIETSLPGECLDAVDYQVRAFIEMNE